MNTELYEHHLTIEQDKLCPFIFNTHTNSFNGPCNWHENIEVILVIEGSGFIKYEAKEYSLNPDDIVIVNSGAMHRIYSHTGITYHYLIMDQTFCSDNGINTASYCFSEKINSPKAVRLFHEIVQAMALYNEHKAPLNAARLRMAVLTLLIDLCTNHATIPTNTVPNINTAIEHIKKALTFINAHYCSHITLEEIAEHVGLNKFYLTRAFKKYTGQPLFTYVNILRCKKARRCILDGMTITEAALESGFETLSYFSRTHSKLMGYAPSQIKYHENLE